MAHAKRVRSVVEGVVVALEDIEQGDLIDHEDYIDDHSLRDFLGEVHECSVIETQGIEGLPSLSELKKQFKTKSAVIRHLYTQGHSVKVIHKHLGIRYQHVRNVLTTELKRGPNEPFKIDDYRSAALPPLLTTNTGEE